ncbi:hypothetical protein G7Y85_10130 [Solimonas terrae]|uniref:Uncharacterized protein n=1 Tax=Solimonas terrae TaxID=1396819 RepID=A0A6M2BRB0_9GAMM|nr:hypothetical protein [Solimonas terrae]
MPEFADWPRDEVEAIVADCFHMLTLELAARRYGRSTHRAPPKAKLKSRSDESVGRKHQNISAAMIAHGYPFIRGCKSPANCQALLSGVVASRPEQDTLFDNGNDGYGAAGCIAVADHARITVDRRAAVERDRCARAGSGL